MAKLPFLRFLLTALLAGCDVLGTPNLEHVAFFPEKPEFAATEKVRMKLVNTNAEEIIVNDCYSVEGLADGAWSPADNPSMPRTCLLALRRVGGGDTFELSVLTSRLLAFARYRVSVELRSGGERRRISSAPFTVAAE